MKEDQVETTVPCWQDSLAAKRAPVPASRHYTLGYMDGYRLLEPHPPKRSTAANRPSWLLDAHDWYMKGCEHGFADRQEAAKAASDG